MNIRTRLTLSAGVVIIVLTAAAFWLSYAHLHDVAATYGLGVSPERAWAWPATLDLFIIAGEILMLVAALNGKRDPWAIALTVAGSVGSIALNVLGVGTAAPVLAYVVAAVPPAAALLAFGALMRQLHTFVNATAVQAPVSEDSEESHEEAPVQTLPAVEPGPSVALAQAPQVATLAEILAEDLEADDVYEEDEPEPEIEAVTAPVPSSGVPSTDEVHAAVSSLRAAGKRVSGTTVGDWFGCSGRTGRRYLKMIDAA
jgi:hypothetical protein